MVTALNLNSDPNEIWKLLANQQNWGDFFSGGQIDIGKLPASLRQKIEAKKSEFLEEGDPDQIDTQNEIEKFAKLLGQEMKNIPGLPPGFDPQLLIDWILNKQSEQNQGGGQNRGSMGPQQFSNTRPASFNPGGGSSGGAPSGARGGGGATGAPDAAVGPVQVGANSQDIMSRMDQLDKMGVPYLWGGGHGGKLTSAQQCANGLDCSGSVSFALGIDPMVSGNFGSVGTAQPGPNSKGVTVYYNDGHVFMSIKGQDGKEHFWGTSSSNPGGGPGWMDRPSDSYLSQFQRRYV
jgi:hypothetical protein